MVFQNVFCYTFSMIYFRSILLVALFLFLPPQIYTANIASAADTDDEFQEFLDEEDDAMEDEEIEEDESGEEEDDDDNEEDVLELDEDASDIEDADGEDINLPFSGKASLNHSSERALSGIDKPDWTLFMGGAQKSYPTNTLSDKATGLAFGFNTRLLEIPLPLTGNIFFNLYAAGTYLNLGDISQPNIFLADATDLTVRAGVLGEWELFRRLQVFALASYQYTKIGGTGLDTHKDRLKDNGLKISLGGQYEWYVVPYGSMGLRVLVDTSLITATLTLAVAPVPRSSKPIELDFDD